MCVFSIHSDMSSKTPDGWQAKFTDGGIAKRFPSFDDFVAAHA